VRELARELLDLAHKGLAARRCLNAAGDDETGFLRPLFESVESGRTPAERLLERYRGDWNGKIEPLFREHAYY